MLYLISLSLTLTYTCASLFSDSDTTPVSYRIKKSDSIDVHDEEIISTCSREKPSRTSRYPFCLCLFFTALFTYIPSKIDS